MTLVLGVLKSMPAYTIGLFQDHTILMAVLAVLFIFVTFFSNKIANKLRFFFTLASLLMIVFSLISQSWTRIGFIVLGLLALAVVRLVGFIITEIRITRKNKRIAERALEKAAKRRGSWQNKQGYSGARKLIVEPEYVPGKMNREEIEDIIKNEFADKKPEEAVTEETAPVKEATEEVVTEETPVEETTDAITEEAAATEMVTDDIQIDENRSEEETNTADSSEEKTEEL